MVVNLTEDATIEYMVNRRGECPLQNVILSPSTTTFPGVPIEFQYHPRVTVEPLTCSTIALENIRYG